MHADLPPFQIGVKPAAAACTPDCISCVFLTQQASRSGGLCLDEPTLRTSIGQLLAAQAGDVVTLVWRGDEQEGEQEDESARMGLDFLRTAVHAGRHARPGVTVEHTLQTEGRLLDHEWCEFLRENDFLVVLSIDAGGVAEDGGAARSEALHAAQLLRAHRVDFNVLTGVHAANAAHPLELYRFLRDEVRSEWVQFVPVVERSDAPRRTPGPGGSTLSKRSLTPRQWGDFLCAVFDEWVRHDVGRMYINIFEASLAAWLGAPPPLCIFAESCGLAPALEHSGDLYSCQHFVQPEYLLGNIRQQSLVELVNSPQQQAFGEAKHLTLPAQCRTCPVLFACHGECPKNRFERSAAGEAGLNYLCAGYLAYFTHIDRAMRVMAQLYRMGRAPAEVMAVLDREEMRWKNAANQLNHTASGPSAGPSAGPREVDQIQEP